MEKNALNCLNHIGVIKLYESIITDDKIYFCLE